MIWGRSPVFELETLNACPWPLAVSAGSHLGDIGSHGEPFHTHFMGWEKLVSARPWRFAHVCVDETQSAWPKPWHRWFRPCVRG